MANKNNKGNASDKYIDYTSGADKIKIDDKIFTGMQDAFQEAINNNLKYMTVQMEDGIKQYSAKIPMKFGKNVEKKLENLYVNTVDVISQNINDGLEKVITSYSQKNNKSQGFTKTKTEVPIISTKNSNLISSTNVKKYAKNPSFSPDIVKQSADIHNYVTAMENSLYKDISQSSEKIFQIAQSNYESINHYNSEMAKSIQEQFKTMQGATKKFSDNLIVHDTETIGKNRTIAQYSARYRDKEFSQIMKLQEDDINYLNELYDKASRKVALSQDELRNLLYATDYTSNNGRVSAKHNSYDYKNVKMTDELLKKIKAGIDILDPHSKQQYSGIVSQKEGAINFNNWIKGLNLGDSLPMFMGTNTHGFDDPIVKRWMKNIWNGQNGNFNSKNLKSFDMLSYIKQMFPRGMKYNNKMLLSNRLEKIADFVGIDLEDFAKNHGGTQHTGDFDTELTKITFDKLMSLVNSGAITPIDKFKNASSYSLSDLKTKHFVSGRTSFRPNELSFKTDKTGKKMIQDEFKDNFFIKGGVYSLLDLVEKNGQNYGVFQDQLSGQKNYVAYDQLAEIETLLNSLTGGTFKENGLNNENLRKDVHNAAKYKMFNGRHASYFFDKFKELNKSKGKGYQESGYVTDIFNQLQDTSFIDELDAILSKTNYNQLSYEGKSAVLNKIGGQLGGKKFKTFTGNDIFKEIKAKSGSGMVAGRMQKNFGDYIERLRQQGAFSQDGYKTVLEAYKSIISNRISDFDLRGGDTSYNTLANIISDSITPQFLSKNSNPWFSVNVDKLKNNDIQLSIAKYVEQAQSQFGTIEDGDTGISRFISNLQKNNKQGAVDALYGAHLPKLLQTLGKYEAATKISTFGGKNYQLLSKDFGKGLSEGSLGGILKKIEKQAAEWGLNTRFELNNEGDAIKLGFYDAYKNPFDEKGNYQWDQGFSTTLGLAQKDGTIRVGNQKKANFMNIYNDKQRGMTLQTLQEAQAVKILNAFMNDNSKLKALVLGETSDYEEATRYLARVRNTALDNAPNSGSYINSAMEEADKSTNAGNIEQNVTRMQSIQMGAYFKNKIREYLKGQADATTKRQEHFEDVDYNNIEGMLNNRLKQVSQSLIMTNSGIEGRKIVLGTPEFRWIEKSGIMNDIDAISQLGFKFGPNNEEAALTGIIGMGGSSTFDAFNVLQPDWHRASEQTKNRAKMKAKKGSLIDNKTVFENIMGSDIGSALGINYNDESYGQQVFAETSDKIIMQAYKNIFKKHNPKKTDQEIEKMLENKILPSVHNDSAIIRDSALKNRQVLTKSSNTLSMDDAKKYFKDTLFSALEDKDSIKDWDNIKKYVTNEGRKYLDNFQIDQMYFSDGQLIISKSRWDDLKSGFKGLGEHGSRKTWQGINQGDISDEIFNEIARLSGLGENADDITGFYEKPKNDRKNSLQSVGGRYQYLLTKFFNGDKGFKRLSEDDKKAKISKFQDAIKDLPVLSKMLEWDPINEKIQRKKDFKESSVSEDDWTNFLDVWKKDPDPKKKSEWEKLDEALFGSEGRENRRGRMAESLGQMKEYEWFSPTGTGGTAYSHTSMTKKGVDAMNRAMNFVNALKKGNSTVSTLQKLMNNYYIPEQSQNLLAEEKNIYDSLAYFKSEKSKQDINENTDDLIITNDLSKQGDNILQIKDLASQIVYDKSGKVANPEHLAMNIIRKKLGDNPSGRSVILDLGEQHNFSWKDFYGNQHLLEAKNMQLPVTFDNENTPAESTFALQRLMQSLYSGEAVDSNLSAYLFSLHKAVKGKEGRVHKSFNSKKLENTIALNTGGSNIFQTENLNGYSIMNPEDLREILSVDKRADNAEALYEQNNNNLQHLYQYLYGDKADTQFKGKTGVDLETALLDEIVKALTYENTQLVKNGDGTTSRKFNNREAGLAAFFDRYPFINGMDIQATKLLISDKVVRGKMINSLGNILNAHGDYDGDKGYITMPWLNEWLDDEAFTKAMGGFEDVHQFQKRIDKIQEEAFKNDLMGMTPEQKQKFQDRMDNKETGESARSIAKDILNPTDEALVTAMAKSGRASIGSLSNISSQIKNVMKDIGADANSLNLDSENSVLNTISSLIVSGTTQSFEQDAISSKKVINRLADNLNSNDKFGILNSLSNFADMLFSANDFSKISDEAIKMNIFDKEKGVSNDAVIKNSAIIKEIYDASSDDIKTAIRNKFSGLFNENGEMDLTHFSIDDINTSFRRINDMVKSTFGDKYNLFSVKNFGKYKEHEEIYNANDGIKKVFGAVSDGNSQDTKAQAAEVNGQPVNGFDLSKADVGQLTVGQIITNSIVSGNSSQGNVGGTTTSGTTGIVGSISGLGNKNPILSSAIDVLNGGVVANAIGGVNNGYIQDLPPFEQLVIRNSQSLKPIKTIEAGPATLRESDHKYLYQDGFAQRHGKNPNDDIQVDISTSKLAEYYKGIPKTYNTSLSQLGYSDILDDFLNHVQEGTLDDYALQYIRSGSSHVFSTKKGGIQNIYDLADVLGEKNLSTLVRVKKSSLYGTAAHSLLQNFENGATDYDSISYKDALDKDTDFSKWMSQLESLSPNLTPETIFKTIQNYAGQIGGLYQKIGETYNIDPQKLLKNNLREKSYYADFELEDLNGEKLTQRVGTTFDDLIAALGIMDYKTGKIIPEKVRAQIGSTFKVLQARDATTRLANYELAASDLGFGKIKDDKFQVDKDKEGIYQDFVNMIMRNGTATVLGKQAGNSVAVTMPQLTDSEFATMLQTAAIARMSNSEQKISGMLPLYNDITNVSTGNYNAYKAAMRQYLNGDREGVTSNRMISDLQSNGFSVSDAKYIDENTFSRTFKKLDEITGQVIEFTAKFAGKVENADAGTFLEYDKHQVRQHSKKDDIQYQRDAYLEEKAKLETATQLEKHYEDLLNNKKDGKVVDSEGNIVSDSLQSEWTKLRDTYESQRRDSEAIIANMDLNNNVIESYDAIYATDHQERVNKDIEKLKKTNNLNTFQGLNDTARSEIDNINHLRDDMNSLAKKIRSGKVEDTAKAKKNLEDLTEQYEALIREFNKTVKSMDELMGNENNVFSQDLKRQFAQGVSKNDFEVGNDDIITGVEANKIGKEYLEQMKQESKLKQDLNKTNAALAKERKTSEKYTELQNLRMEQEQQLANLSEYGIQKSVVETDAGEKKSVYSRVIRDFDGNVVFDDNGNAMREYFSMGKNQAQQNQKEFKLAQQLQLQEMQQSSKLAKPSLWSQFKAQWKGTMQYILMGQSAYMMIGKIQQAISQVIQLTKQLDQTMTNLMIVTGKSHAQVKDMIKDYSKLADELGATTQEVSSSANEWLRMGYTVDQTNTLIKNSMMLSKLGMIESGQATEYLISAIKGYGVAVEDSSKIVDMATALDMKYAVSSGYILEGMSKAAASAKLAKVEMADLQSMIAIVGETTQKSASSIGESFKTAFARYGNVKAGVFSGDVTITGEDGESYSDNSTTEGVNDIEKVLSKVGISLRESDLKTWRSYSDILKDIGKGWATYSDYEKNAITTAMFGTRQRENGLVVLSNYNRVLEANKVAISSVGTASKKYEAYQNSLEAATKRVSAAWEQLVLDLGEDGTLKDLSETLAFMLKHLRGITVAAFGLYAAFNFDKIIAGLAKMSVFLNGTTMGLAKGITSPFTDFDVFKQGFGKKWKDSLSEASGIYKNSKVDPIFQSIDTHVSNIDAKMSANTKNMGAEGSFSNKKSVSKIVQDFQNKNRGTKNDITTNPQNAEESQDKPNFFKENRKKANYALDKNELNRQTALKSLQKQKLKEIEAVNKERDAVLSKNKILERDLIKSIKNDPNLSDSEKQALIDGISRQGVEDRNKIKKDYNNKNRDKLKEISQKYKDKEQKLNDNFDKTKSNIKKEKKRRDEVQREKNRQKRETTNTNNNNNTTGDSRKNNNNNNNNKWKNVSQKYSLPAETESSISNREIAQQASLTVGTIVGSVGGMSLGANIAEAIGGNATIGAMIGMSIGGVVPSIVQQLAPTVLGGFAGPLAGVVMAGLGVITSLVKNHHEEQLKIAKEALAKAEENYEAATKQETKDKISRYEELVQGVDENGKNVSLTTDEYQEFLDISNSLASIFPELVRQVDEYGNSLLGANGELNDANKEVGSIKEKIPELTKNLQKMADVKLLNDTVMKDDIGNRLKGVGWNKDSTYYDAQKKADKAEIKGSFLNYQLIKNSDNSGQIVGRGISADEISTILSSEAKNKVYIYENQDGTVFYQSKEDVSQEDFSEVIKELNQYVQTVNSRENAPYNNEANSYNQIAKQELQGVIQDYLPSILRQKSGYTVTDEQMKMALNIGQNLDTKSRGVITASNIEDKMNAIANLIVADKNNNLGQMQEIDTNTMSYDEYQSKIKSNIKSYRQNIYDSQGNLTKDFVELATGMGYKKDELQNDKIIDQIILKMSGLNENDLALTEQVYNKFRSKNGFRQRNSVLSSIDLNQLTAGQLKQLYSLSDTQQDRFSTQLKEIGVSIENITKLLNELNPQNFYSMVSALEGLWEKSDNSDFYSSWEDWVDSFDDTDTLLNALSNLDETGFAKSYVEILKEQADNLNISLKDALKNYRALKDLDANGRSSKSVKTLVDDRENLLKIYKSIMTTNTLSSEDLETLKPIFSDIMTTVATKGKAGVAKEISDYLSVGNPETMFGSIKNQLDNENDFFNSVLKGTKDEQVLKYVKNKAEVDQIAKSAGYTAQTMHNFNPNQDFETTLKSMKKFYEDQGRTFEDNSQFIEWVLKEQFQVSTEDFNEAKNNAGIEDLLQKILSAIFGIDINSYEVNINQAAQQAYSQIDDAQFFSKEDKDKFKDDYKSLAKAKEEESKRQRDRAKELRNQAKEEREIERSKRDQINKEYLQALTDTMERRNLIIQKYDDKLKTTQSGEDLLDTADYGGKQIALDEQYGLTSEKLAESKKQFEELANTIPHTAEEADKISSKMSELKSNIIDGTISLHTLTKQMQENAFDALANSIENANKQLEAQITALSNVQQILDNDNGIVNAWDMAVTAYLPQEKSTDEIKDRTDYLNILKLEDEYEQNILNTRTQYYDLLKKENQEANEDAWYNINKEAEDLKDTRADNALSAKWAEIEYQEALKNFKKEHGDIIQSMGDDWKSYTNYGIDNYKRLKTYLEQNELPLVFVTYKDGKKITKDKNGNELSEDYANVLNKNKASIGDVVKTDNDVYVVQNEGQGDKHDNGLYYRHYTKSEYRHLIREGNKNLINRSDNKNSYSPSMEDYTNAIVSAYNDVKPETVVAETSGHLQEVSDKVMDSVKLKAPELDYDSEKGWSDKGLIQHIKNVLTGVSVGGKDYGVFLKVNDWLQSQQLLGAPGLKEAEWTSLGKLIGEYISDGILQGVWDGEKRTALEQIGPIKGMTDVGGKTVFNGVIPKGASVYFYSPHSNDGHVGIWDGNGKLYHNVGRNGKQGKIKLSSIADLEREGYTYRGWGYNGGRQLSSLEADNIIKVAQNSSAYGINPIGGRCQAWVADVYAKATGTSRISSSNAITAGDKWIIGTSTVGGNNFWMNNQDNGLMQIILQSLDKEGMLNKADWNPDESTSARYIYDYLIKQGFNNKAIAAILGNWQQESGLNPNKHQIGGNAYGIAQWDGGRKQRLFDFAKSQNPTLLQQLDWFMSELKSTEKKGLKVLLNSDLTLDEMTVQFEKAFERAGKPAYRNRTDYAQNWYNLISKYANGTDKEGHRGGPALVGEGQNPEVVSAPNSEAFVVDKPTIIPNMPKGTQVMPIPQYAEGTGTTLSELLLKFDKLLNTTDEINKNVVDINDKDTLYKVLENVDILAELGKSGRSLKSLIEDDKKARKMAFAKIDALNISDEAKQQKKDNWDKKYQESILDPNNPYYLTYLTDKFSTKDSDLKKYFSKKIENLRHFYEPIFTDKENGLIENSLSQAQRKGFISEQNNVINTNNLDLYRAQIKNNQEKQKDLYDYLLYLQTHGGDSETIAKTISELQTLNTEITDLDKKVTETKDTISNNVRTYGNELQDDYSYRKQLNSDYYGLGQTFSKGRGQENGLLRKNNIELNREIAEIEGRIRREGLKNGKSESQINNEILADKNLQDLKQTVNQNLSQIKDNIKSDLDDILENLDRNVKKLELTKPEKWSAIPQIKRYYNGIREEYKNSLEELEHYLATATNLSLDEQKDLYDQINQMKKNLLDNDISRVSDIIAYQETIYSALQYQVNDYIDTLNEEKDLVSKRYDEEIKKLQQVNTDKERSIKLTQLQQDLENAQKQKKRVYRAGVGFVYEADRAEEKKARQSLDSFYREDKISDLNTAKDLETSYYDKKIEGWNTYLKGIEKVYKTEERLQNQELLMKELNVKSVEELNKKLIDDRDDYVIEVAKNNAKYKFFNTEYKGCWSDFLDSYNSNVRQLRIYQEEELKLRSEYLKAYKDAYVQTYDKTTTADIKDVLNFTHQYGITDIQDLIHKMSEDQTLEKHYSGLGYGIDKLQSFHETKQNYFETLIKDPKLDVSSILLGRSANTTGLNFEELRQLLYNKLNYLQSNDPTIDVDSRFKEAENLIAQENKNHILLGDISKYSDAQNANLQGMKKDFSGKMSKIVNSNLASDQKQQAISDLLSETYDVLASTSEMQNNSQNVINTMKNWVVNDGVYNSFRSKLDEIIDTIDSEKKNVDINNNSSSSSSKTGGTIRQVHVDGTAPVGTKIGDIVRTGGGDYKVVDKNTKNAKFNKKSGLWSIKLNANGSKGTTTKDFIAGEKGPEIGILPDGTSVIYGENGPALYEDQPLGTVIFPADKSSNLLSLHENGTVDWDSYNTPRFISKDNSFYPSYSSTLPKFESNGSKGDVYYNIEKVDLPNVKDPENFWTKLNEGVRRHMKDK